MKYLGVFFATLSLLNTGLAWYAGAVFWPSTVFMMAVWIFVAELKSLFLSRSRD